MTTTENSRIGFRIQTHRHREEQRAMGPKPTLRQDFSCDVEFSHEYPNEAGKQVLVFTYTVTDADGQVVGRFKDSSGLLKLGDIGSKPLDLLIDTSSPMPDIGGPSKAVPVWLETWALYLDPVLTGRWVRVVKDHNDFFFFDYGEADVAGIKALMAK